MQCDLENATIHYEEFGPGRGQGRPIVFLHGWSMDRRVEIPYYEPIFAARGGWRRIYPDLPGMGESRAKRIRNQDDVLAALLAFIDHVLPASASCWQAPRAAATWRARSLPSAASRSRDCCCACRR
jgi:pimeloyl-ACP methyl ester carboxylesterase